MFTQSPCKFSNQQRIMKNCRLFITLATVFVAAITHAATLSLNDGSMIKGSLEKIHGGKVFFKTEFAGTLEIPQDKVAGLDSEDPVVIHAGTDEVFQGTVVTAPGGDMTVASSAGAAKTNIKTVKSAWKPGQEDPIVVSSRRKWGYTAGVDISGSSGNSENLGSALHMQAKLEGPEDRLLMYASYKYKETEGVKSQDEQKGGIKYTNFLSGKWGWFVREEIERDSFENIAFRSTTAAGVTRKFIDEKRQKLEGSAGISYRFESYTDFDVTGAPVTLDDEGFPGLDLALDHMWQFADWGKVVTHISYIPSVDDFGDYLIDHESGVDIPLDTADAWVLRFGLSNQYNSNPNTGREKLDTTYFARLILNWE